MVDTVAELTIAQVIYDIAAERVRQLEVEHYSAAHDDVHDRGELALAAATYALPPEVYRWLEANDVRLWPWAYGPKFKDRRRDLVCAGALIVAEIERLDRAADRARTDDCPGHVASARDPKVCARCGVHIDELRPPAAMEAPDAL